MPVHFSNHFASTDGRQQIKNPYTLKVTIKKACELSHASFAFIACFDYYLAGSGTATASSGSSLILPPMTR